MQYEKRNFISCTFYIIVQQQQIWKGLFLLMVIIMMTSLFVSRALLSISSVAIVAFSLFNINEKRLKQLFVATALIILPVVVSGLWSDNKEEWWRALEVKVPLIAVGLGIAAATISLKEWRMVVLILLAFVTLGTLWSTYQLIANYNSVLANYLKAKVTPTPLDDDHIRFSWLVVLTCLLSIKSLANTSSKSIRTLIVITVCWLVIYLHILAAKTGLICLYISALILTINYIIEKKKWLVGGIALAAIITFPIVAVLTIPTLRNRFQYVVYDFNNYSKGNFIPGLSDGARVLSLKAGWSITKHHPLTGVGFGDMKAAVRDWHQTYQPTSFEYEKFLPLNEWLFYGTGSGLFGIISFTVGIPMLLSMIWKTGIIEKAIAVVLLIPLITDDTLESQFGVVIFIFVLMWLVLHQKINQQAVA
jgi:O-antigen ligase